MSGPAGPGLAEPWGALTVSALAEKAAQERPARVFIRDCPNREAWNGVEPRALTTDAFLRNARFLAGQMRTLGLMPGEAVLMLLPNLVEAPMAILAAHLAGAVPAVAPVDESPDMLRAAAERCDAAMILTTGRVGDLALGEKARQVAAKVMSVRVVAGFGFDLPEGIVSLEGWSDDEVAPLAEATRKPGDIGLVTFARQAGGLVAAERLERQMIAEALALAPVLRLDGRRGIISLMHPGAAASVAAALTLPLHAGADIRLVGPYETGALISALKAEPDAFLYCPDHFAAWLAAEQLGPDVLRNLSGLLALARVSGREGAVPPCTIPEARLIADFDERGLVPLARWPKDGRLALPARIEHPMQDLLPEGTALLEIPEEAGAPLGGFGAARIIQRGMAPAGKAA